MKWAGPLAERPRADAEQSVDHTAQASPFGVEAVVCAPPSGGFTRHVPCPWLSYSQPLWAGDSEPGNAGWPPSPAHLSRLSTAVLHLGRDQARPTMRGGGRTGP